jgi:hypothetical protein
VKSIPRPILACSDPPVWAQESAAPQPVLAHPASGDLPDGRVALTLSSPSAKNISLPFYRNLRFPIRHSARAEGRYGRSSRNVRRDAVDATMSCAHEVAGRGHTRERSTEACETSGIDAYGEVVWSWHPLLVSSLAEAHSAQPGYEMPCNPLGNGGKINSSPGERV